VFTAISIAAFLGLFFALTFHRFRTTRPQSDPSGKAAASYLPWLSNRTSAWLKTLRVAPLKDKWQASPFHGLSLLDKILAAVLLGSFLYLAASGFLAAFFIGRGLYGVPLILHVMAGGLFSVCLTAVVFREASRFQPPQPSNSAAPSISDLERRKAARIELPPLPSQQSVRIWMFWIFAAAGLALIVSTLLPMLPWLNTRGQVLMFETHRYAALVSVLAAIVYVYLSIFDKPPS
jgi:hypothetical protein